jgi:hypothetical protein
MGFRSPMAGRGAGCLCLAGVIACATVALGQSSGAASETGGRVQLELRVAGDLFATAAPDAAPVRQPITLEATFDFLERPEPAAGPRGVARRYRAAEATIHAAGRQTRRQLAADAAELLVALEGTTPVPYLAAGFLSRNELELLQVPCDPLLVDGLRPDRVVTARDSWKLDADLAAGLLAIDTIDSGGLEATLETVAEGVARIRLAGTIVGGVDGAPTRLEVQGTAHAAATAEEDGEGWRIDGAVAELEATISERREAGWVSPGLAIEATVVMRRSATIGRTPVEAESTAERAALPDRPQGEGRPGMIWHRHPGDRYALVLDSRWRVVEDGPEGLVMRFVDRGALVAQCSILPLPRIRPDSPPSEETVGKDLRRSLAEQFGLLAESEAVRREDGTRVVRVVADGAADG